MYSFSVGTINIEGFHISEVQTLEGKVRIYKMEVLKQERFSLKTQTHVVVVVTECCGTIMMEPKFFTSKTQFVENSI